MEGSTGAPGVAFKCREKFKCVKEYLLSNQILIPRMGIPAEHLITCSFMAAPASLAVSKLFYPETEKSKTTINDIKVEKGEESNVLDAAAKVIVNSITNKHCKVLILAQTFRLAWTCMDLRASQSITTIKLLALHASFNQQALVLC